MIRKFLIVSKQLYLSTTKVDDEQGNIYNIDLFMPLEVYWKIGSLLKEADYLIASKEQMADVQALYKNVFKLAVPYTIFENDKTWIIKHLHGPPKGQT